MNTFPIVHYPAPILNKTAEPIRTIPSDIKDLVEKMKVTMKENDGIGLAAPQIDKSEQLIIVQTGDGPLAFLNPKITSYSKKQETEEEGCLSLPNIFFPVKRSVSVEVECQTPDGKHIRLAAEGLLARIFQHEIDHLNGKLIINRTTPLRRMRIRKELRALERESQKH